MRLRSLPVVLPALLLLPLLPTGAAQAGLTLADLQEPQLGNNRVVDVTVTPEEAGKSALAVFLNPPGKPFGLVVYRQDGSVAYERNGSRGVQGLPALEAGPHKFFIRGEGAFQVALHHLDRLNAGERVTEANGTLDGPAAFLLAPTRSWELHVEGGVRAEWRDLAGATRDLTLPANVSVPEQGGFVLTLRGEPGAAYRVWLVPVGPEPVRTSAPIDAPRGEETPGPAPALLVGVVVAAALALRRKK